MAVSTTIYNVPATGTSLAGASASALRAVAFNKQLQEESILGSIWDKLSDTVKVDPMNANIDQVPMNTLLLKIESTLQGKIPTAVVIGMKRPYSECPRLGPSQRILGYEEKSKWRYTSARYNEIKKGVTDFGWGMYSNEQEFYDNLKKVTPGMIQYFAELHDQRVHEALMMTMEKCLITDPWTAFSQQFNPNWFVPNTQIQSMPAYDSAALSVAVAGTCPQSDTLTGDFVEDIGDALFKATNSGANPEYCQLLVDGLIALDFHARQNIKMPKVKIGKGLYRVLVLPSSMGAVLKNPKVNGSIAEALKYTLSSADPKVLELPMLLGIIGDMIIVENERYPTLTLGGMANGWTLQPGFMYPGNNDGRNTGAWSNASGDLNYVFHMGFLLGQNALIEFVANPLKYNLKEFTEYEQIVGQAGWTGAGLQLPVFDQDTKTDLSYYLNSSILVPIAAPSLVTTK
jgi:hypothetical protein